MAQSEKCHKKLVFVLCYNQSVYMKAILDQSMDFYFSGVDKEHTYKVSLLMQVDS